MSERERSISPWYLLALILGDGLKIKKRERIKPRKTPRNIITESASICVVVFTSQIY
jgi:hypothetical protein